MPHEQIVIPTADGHCPAHLLTPAGTGPWPAVIVYMDALAIRPALIALAQRIADAGYCVLLPDFFYRAGAYPVMDPVVVFQGDLMGTIGPLMATTGYGPATRDTQALLGWLETRSDVARFPMGVVGYCMGGGMALTAAGRFPDQIAAAASFHGGALATDAPDSPHLLAPHIRAEVLVAGADKDDFYPLAMHQRLVAALDAAGLRYTAEIYAGALHGWMQTDFPVYDHDAAERGWAELLALFARNLG
ncbi:dienelactone hydrolase family protein [Novosphingobium sp.]|uniref:dienelactone hydrolase family protein n=1 Tax=Novosphingobium sp. TaxID=1874826 RepID=UPI003342A361